MNINYKENQDGSLEIVLSFSKFEICCLKHDLHGLEGIIDWYAKGPSSEKILRCKERMEKDGIALLRAKGISVPAEDEKLQELILIQPEYKDRQTREKEFSLKQPPLV